MKLSQLEKYADLVAMVVQDFLCSVSILVVGDLGQGFITARIGVHIGVGSVCMDLLQQVAAVPDEFHPVRLYCSFSFQSVRPFFCQAT